MAGFHGGPGGGFVLADGQAEGQAGAYLRVGRIWGWGALLGGLVPGTFQQGGHLGIQAAAHVGAQSQPDLEVGHHLPHQSPQLLHRSLALQQIRAVFHLPCQPFQGQGTGIGLQAAVACLGGDALQRLGWDLLDERLEALFLRRVVAQQLVHAVVPHMLMQQDAGEGRSWSD